MNAIEQTVAYYRSARRSKNAIVEDARYQDVFVYTPELVLMARRVNSNASPEQIIDVRVRFPRHECDAWYLHFLAGNVESLGIWVKDICSLPWILTQHGKRGDSRLTKLDSQRFCRMMNATYKWKIDDENCH